MRTLRRLAILGLVCLMTACVSDLRLPEPAYEVPRSAPDAAVVAVIDRATLNGLYPVKASFTAGLNAYYLQPGQMLKEAADHDLGGMFGSYRAATDFAVPDQGAQRLTVFLEVPDYTFTDGVVSLQVRARVFGPKRNELLSKIYLGKAGSSELDFGGVGLRGTLEKASAEAYRQAFAGLRADLEALLQARRGVPG